MAATNFSPFNAVNLRGPVTSQSSFTFTTPTQCSTHSTPRPCIQTMSPINMGAPGVGASWQHSVPTAMPWVDMSTPSHSSAVGSATVFTGARPYSPVIGGAQSYAAEHPRRLKRKSNLSAEGPLAKVQHCADQLANMRISPLAAQSDSGLACDVDQWERFQELERRLSADMRESEFAVGEAKPDNSNGVRVSIADGVLEDLNSGPSLLPRTVIEHIHKPCMQVVLWKSPESLIGDTSASSSTIVQDKPNPEKNTTSNTSGEAASTSKSHFPSPSSSLQQAFNWQTNGTSCNLSVSPDFLKPLSSSFDSSDRFGGSSSSNHGIPNNGSSPSTVIRPSVSSNNTNGSMFYDNNNIDAYANNNYMEDVVDSIDDDMQL